MEFKDKVKFARQKLMLSQADFAKKLGVAFSTINEWENGVRHPNYIMQRKFAAFCEEYLLWILITYLCFQLDRKTGIRSLIILLL